MAKPLHECADVERCCKVVRSTDKLIGVTFEPYTKTQFVKQYPNNMLEVVNSQIYVYDQWNWVMNGELPD